MRDPGSVMGVAADGSSAGSLSGGCIENAVVSEALDALRAGSARTVRFGAGSPYLDIRLPCGGGLDVHFQPLLEGNGGDDFAARCHAARAARRPFSVVLSGDGATFESGWQPTRFDPENGQGTFGYWPVPKLSVVGHGAGVSALADLARTAGCDVSVLIPDATIAEQMEKRGVETGILTRTTDTGMLESDPWTAIVFLFHDHDWETDLLLRAFELPHFYLGAMGGRRAHAQRCETLRQRGASEADIASIRAPIGLFHSSRDPSTLALSALAEVIRAYGETDFGADLG